MSATSIVALEDLGDLTPPPPTRPRVLLVATVLASAATLMGFVGLLAIYLRERAANIAAGDPAFPDGNPIPLTPTNMSLVGFGLSLVFMHWAVDALGNDDRRHAWMAFGSVLITFAFHLVGTAFLYTQAGFDIATPTGVLFYALTGAHLAIAGGGFLFMALMAFRTLGGQYSAKDREGVVAATVFWWAVAITYAIVWYAIYVTK
jgi:heme/copper-type cytochrome/quinol oxidase subunit 3